MTNQAVVAQDCVALISYHDLPCPHYPVRVGRFWETYNPVELSNTLEGAEQKFREQKAQWQKARGWTYFGPFVSEEEAVAYLDQFGFTRTQEEVEYSGMPPLFETTWVWSYKGSDVKWQLRKISSSQLQEWSENEPDWRISPLSEIPEDRLYPAMVIAQKELQRLEQQVVGWTNHLKQETEKIQGYIDGAKKAIRRHQKVLREHEQRDHSMS